LGIVRGRMDIEERLRRSSVARAGLATVLVLVL
jgi:hypothetical protein